MTDAKYGKKGSFRLDMFKEGFFKDNIVEVKNYSIHLDSGRRNLIHNISKQYSTRVGQRFTQTYLIETRGMQVSREMLEELSKKILEATGKGITIRYLF